MTHKNEKRIVFVPRTLANPEKVIGRWIKEKFVLFLVLSIFINIYNVENLETFKHACMFSLNRSIYVLSAARMQRYALYLGNFQYGVRK